MASELKSWWDILKKLNSLCIYSYTCILIKTEGVNTYPWLTSLLPFQFDTFLSPSQSESETGSWDT